ncbi:hypothetical protein CLV35_2309 [Motilibacter peucedani]|uniref:Uncharacterized protein n=1 Tax=Motilibacter peucedani TaxID=598650 RepID=A0A420XNQ6_9ACTN|nr:hypothetical protein [Motilibacter peucedani]RKS73818.1 hypothetical protein CLV35_2309 [Motilibacter peucedani]
MGLVRVLLPLLVVLVLLAVVLGALPRRRAELDPGPSQWVPAHIDRDGTTVVLVRRIALETRQVLEERYVEAIPSGAPDHDERFLAAMAAARARAALFASEED